MRGIAITTNDDMNTGKQFKIPYTAKDRAKSRKIAETMVKDLNKDSKKVAKKK